MHELNLMVILLLSISTNLDNFGIGVTYGIRKINIPFISNLIIGALNGSGNYVAMVLGERIYHITDPDRSKYIGIFIIIFVGIWTIVQELIARRNSIKDIVLCDSEECGWNIKLFVKKIIMILKNPVEADIDSSGDIDIKESVLLGLALTFTNLAGGVGAGMMGLSPVLTTAMVFLFSIVTILAGLRVGRYWLARLFGNLSGPIAGLLLIIIGIYEIVS